MRVWDVSYKELGEHKRIFLKELHPRIWYDACRIMGQAIVLRDYHLLPKEVVAFYSSPDFQKLAPMYTAAELVSRMQFLLDRMDEQVRPLHDVLYDNIEDFMLRLRHYDDVLMRRHHPAHYMPGDATVEVVPLASNGHAI